MVSPIVTKDAPAAIGPYSQGIVFGNMVYTSGQIPVNPADGTVPATIEEQTAQSLNNVKAVLEAAGTGTLYLCDGYSVAVQTLPAGNLDATVREVTGYGRDKVQLWQQKEGEHSRYNCVWASAGEGGDQMCKATILDDGNYHYVLSVMAAAEDAGDLAETWQQLMDSFSIAP